MLGMEWPSAPIRKAIIAAVMVLLAGCTTTTIKPELAEKPGRTYDAIAVGEVTASEDTWQELLPHFREGLIAKFREMKAYKEVLNPAPSPLPPSTLVVSGRITEIERGNKAMRALIGFGAGRAYAGGMFEVADQDGNVLTRFHSRKAYSGGAGIGGFDLLDMQDLARKLGEDTAESIVRWTLTGKLEE